MMLSLAGACIYTWGQNRYLRNEVMILRSERLSLDTLFQENFLKRQIWEITKNQILYRLNNVEHWQSFEKKRYLKNKVKSWRELNGAVNAYYEIIRQDLESRWQLKGNLLKAAFLTAIVANFFPVGGTEQILWKIEGIRSVRQYAAEQGVKALVPFEFYLNSPGAECNDFATLLYILMELNGFKSRHVGPDPSHIHIQSEIDGSPWIFDAMNGFFSEGSAESFYSHNLSANKRIYIVPTGGADPGSPHFRMRLGHFQAYSFMTSGMTTQQPIYYPHWDHLQFYLDKNAVPFDPKKHFNVQ